MGLLDYYRQFEELPEEEVNRELRERNAERKAKELTKVQTLDLSEITSPHAPHPDVVSAVTFVARRGMQRYPRSSELTSELSYRHEVQDDRIAIGNGASELLQAAAVALMRPGQALLSPWPSHPLFPLIARRAHGIAVPVSGGVDALLQAASQHDTRVIALASPNNPTGELTSPEELDRLLSSLPDTVAVLLDEALIEYSGLDAGERDASIALLERHQRLLVFRTFSKAWGLAGMRCGYVIGGPGAEGLLAEISPEHGVSELSQAAALEALRSCEGELSRRVRVVGEQRALLTDQLRAMGLQVTDSSANFLWVAHQSLDGAELSARLRRSGVIVAPGATLAAPEHVRITVRDRPATDRLLRALEGASSTATAGETQVGSA